MQQTKPSGKLKFVTITGADDGTPPAELIRVARKYPFVEWGILYADPARCLTPRWPSRQWLGALFEQAETSGVALHLSLHLCGNALSKLAKGDSTPVARWLGAGGLSEFDRIQLNWHGKRNNDARDTLRDGLVSLVTSSAYSGFLLWPEIIFQLDGVNDELVHSIKPNFIAEGLFDQSHGNGLPPRGGWPVTRSDVLCGWSGGLGPTNLTVELPRIDSLALGMPYWIDMETNVRTDDGERLDMARVERVLEIAKPYVEVATDGESKVCAGDGSQLGEDPQRD